MSTGLYDDIATAVPASSTPASASSSGLYDDLLPKVASAISPPRAPASTADRIDAAEGGLLKGAAYLATLPADTAANIWDLGKAGLGYGYSKLTGDPVPSALEVNSGPSPVGAWLTRQMDRSPITSTQPRRPDDPVSRYLNTVASVVPGAIAGGGGALGATARGLAEAAPGAAAGQYIAEAHPFNSDAANNAASVLTQALVTGAVPRGRGAVLDNPTNQVVRAGQQAGYEFPPATTNPTGLNQVVETVAGKTSTQQHAAIHNQGVTNSLAREDIGLEPSSDPITDAEIAQAKGAAAPAYDALRNAGQIVAPADLRQQLAAAISRSQGASRLAPSLGNSGLSGIVDELGKNQSFDAGDAMDAIADLRDKASAAYRAGNSGDGQAYRNVSNVIENAIDQHLQGQGGESADLLANYRDSRQKFAKIATVEDALNTTGNVDAKKLAGALARGDYLGAPGSGLRTAAEAASQAPRAFTLPEKQGSAVEHLGTYGPFIGLAGLEHFMPEHLNAPETIGAALAVPAARYGARRFALGAPGQALALQRGPAAFPAARLAGALTSAPGIVNSQQ